MSPEWAHVAEGDVVIARVNGVPVTERLLRLQMEAHPTVPVRELLDRLIEIEVVAQRAQADGFNARGAVAERWRQALSQSYLNRVFVVDNSPEKILPDSDIAELYQRPQVKLMFSHPPIWGTLDFQIICCPSGSCDSEESVECFARASEQVSDGYTALKAQVGGVEGDVGAMTDALQALAPEAAKYGLSKAVELSYYYDCDKTQAEQVGKYDVVTEPVAKAACEAPLATLQAPVRSKFGYHILTKVKHVPAKNWGPDHPEVIKTVREKAYPGSLALGFQRFLGERMGDRSVTKCKIGAVDSCPSGYTCTQQKVCIQTANLERLIN